MSALLAPVATSFVDRPLSVMLVLAALSLLPFALVMLTSFVKISVVLQVLRSALGTPQIPPNMVITGLALILSAYVMAPTGAEIYHEASKAPGAERGLTTASPDVLYAALERGKEPLKRFLARHADPADRALFHRMAQRMWSTPLAAAVKSDDLIVIAPAFVVGQLSLAFKIGFLIFIPFLVIELVVSNILLALGMHMLSPTSIALPFKLLLFVMVDGWQLLSQGLVLSYV
jgi:type III secretion protein R